MAGVLLFHRLCWGLTEKPLPALELCWCLCLPTGCGAPLPARGKRGAGDPCTQQHCWHQVVPVADDGDVSPSGLPDLDPRGCDRAPRLSVRICSGHSAI